MGPSPTPPRPMPALTPKHGVEKSLFEIAAKRLEIDHMCQYGAISNTWAGYRISSSRSPCTQNRGILNRRPQIEDIMWGR